MELSTAASGEKATEAVLFSDTSELSRATGPEEGAPGLITPFSQEDVPVRVKSDFRQLKSVAEKPQHVPYCYHPGNLSDPFLQHLLVAHSWD